MLRHALEPWLFAVVFFLGLMKMLLIPISASSVQLFRERYPLSIAAASMLSMGRFRSNRLSCGESPVSPEVTSMFGMFNSGS